MWKFLTHVFKHKYGDWYPFGSSYKGGSAYRRDCTTSTCSYWRLKQ